MCDIPVLCFGVDATAEEVCSGNGDCIKTDKCECYENWKGKTCEKEKKASAVAAAILVPVGSVIGIAGAIALVIGAIVGISFCVRGIAANRKIDGYEEEMDSDESSSDFESNRESVEDTSNPNRYHKPVQQPMFGMPKKNLPLPKKTLPQPKSSYSKPMSSNRPAPPSKFGGARFGAKKSAPPPPGRRPMRGFRGRPRGRGRFGTAPKGGFRKKAAPPPIPRGRGRPRGRGGRTLGRRPANTVRCFQDYIATKNDELTVRVGDVITVNKRENDGWILGTLRGKKGFFPGNFTK